MELTGFPLLDDPILEPDPELDDFMPDAPIVFSLGSSVSQNPGTFYEDSIEAVTRLGLKALILTGKTGLVAPSPNVLIRWYVPHSSVFHRGRIIVHHGGIGTTARALMAGKPQLVVPHFGDQPDNAARLETLGVARTLASNAYSASSAAIQLSEILTDDAIFERAAFLGSQFTKEEGAKHAAKDIIDVITRR